jgi:hypothetical protein
MGDDGDLELLRAEQACRQLVLRAAPWADAGDARSRPAWRVSADSIRRKERRKGSSCAVIGRGAAAGETAPVRTSRFCVFELY